MSQALTSRSGTGWRPADTLATRVRLVRTQLGDSQRSFAMRVGLTYGEVQSLENGAAVRDEVRKVQAICDRTDADREWLLFGGHLGPAEPFPPRDPAGMTDDSGVVTAQNTSEKLHDPLAA